MHVEFQSAHSGTNDRALWKFRKHVRFLNRTVHKDVFGRLTEGHEGDVDEAQCLIDHLQTGRQEFISIILLVGCMMLSKMESGLLTDTMPLLQVRNTLPVRGTASS